VRDIHLDLEPGVRPLGGLHLRDGLGRAGGVRAGYCLRRGDNVYEGCGLSRYGGVLGERVLYRVWVVCAHGGYLSIYAGEDVEDVEEREEGGEDEGGCMY
jgi:hypothetical protein